MLVNAFWKFFGSRHFDFGQHPLRRTLQLLPTLFNRYKKAFILILVVTALAIEVKAQHATWIWYPGDFEVWLGNKMQNRRTERTVFLPPLSPQ